MEPFDPFKVGRFDFDASLSEMAAQNYSESTGRKTLEQKFANVGIRVLEQDMTWHDRYCPLCNSNDRPEPIGVKYGVPIVRCSQCGFMYASPLPDLALNAKHPAWSDVFENNHLAFLSSESYRHYAKRRYAYELKLLAPYVRQGDRLLDIGAAAGTFLEMAAAFGINGTGIEMNPAAGEWARRQGHYVLEGMFPQDLPKTIEPFNIIATLDTIEHVPEPRTFLANIAEALVSKGILFIQVPNVGALATRYRSLEDNIFNGLIHLNYFTLESLTSLCGVMGFELLKMETVLSEWHVVKDLERSQLQALLGADGQIIPTSGITPDWVLDNGLGYKILAVFQKRF